MILQLIDKAGDFVSDDIWFRVVQFVTNNEDLQVSLKSELTMLLLPSLHIVHRASYVFDQPYAAAKAREYLDKPAIHETMVKVCVFSLQFCNCLNTVSVWIIFTVNVPLTDDDF